MLQLMIMKAKQAMYTHALQHDWRLQTNIYKEGRIESIVPRYKHICTCLNLAPPNSTLEQLTQARLEDDIK